MVGVGARENSRSVVIIGHGLSIVTEAELSEGIFLSPNIPELSAKTLANGSHDNFFNYSSAIFGSSIASFCLRVEEKSGGKALVTKAWNSLWLFHLMSLACKSPCHPLFSYSDDENPIISAANPTPYIKQVPKIHVASDVEIDWARKHSENFNNLISVSGFAAAMRCYGNAHLLPTPDVRVMLLWAGIEGILSVDAELSRRIALYASILFDGSAEQKSDYYDFVKKSYGLRSRVVHGSDVNFEKIEGASAVAGQILIDILRKCVEIGRIPSPGELDRLAISASVQ